MITYLVFITKDTDFMAAYGSVYNIIAIIYTVGDTSSFVIRTDMGIKIGKGLNEDAKKFARMGLILNLILML